MKGELLHCQLGDLFDYTIPGEWGSEPTPDNSIPVLRSSDFGKDGKINMNRLVHRSIPPERLKNRVVTKGDIVLEKSGGGPNQPVGRVALCDQDFYGTASNFLEILKVKEKFDRLFVFYLLSYFYDSGLVLNYQQQTTGIINFKLSRYKQEKISIPKARDEQTRIAGVLSVIDRELATTAALVDKHQRVKIGLMQGLLSRGLDANGMLRDPQIHSFRLSPLGYIPDEWDVVTIDQIGSVRLGRQRSPQHQDGTHLKPYLRVANVFDSYIDYSDILEMNFTPIEQETYSVEPGDIFLNEGQSLELVGRSARYSGEKGIYCFQNTLVRFRTFPGNNSYYWQSLFSYWLKLGKFIDVARQTTSIAHLGADRFAKMRVVRPPTPEQDQIVDQIQAIEELISSYQSQHAKLQRLKAGLMSDLLSGRVPISAIGDLVL